MAEPISIKFHVDNTAAKKSIEEVTQALDGVARASAFGESGSTAHAINLKTNAPELIKEAVELTHTLGDVGTAANTAQESLVWDVRFTQAEEQANKLDATLAKTGETAQQTSAKIREVSSAVNGKSVALPAVETSSSIANLQDVENEADEAADAITNANAEFPDLKDSTDRAIANLDKVKKKAEDLSSTTTDENRLSVIRKQTAALDKQLDKAIQIREAMDAQGKTSIGVFNADALDDYIGQMLELRTLMNDVSGIEVINYDRLKNLPSATQKIFDQYKQGIKDIEKVEGELLDKQLKNEEKVAESAEKFKEAQLLKTGSIDELKDALDRYQKELEEANKNEDKASAFNAQKRIVATQAAIERQTKSTERARIAEQRRNAEIIRSGSILERFLSELTAATIDAGTAQQTAGVKAGFFTRAMRGATAAVRGFGVAIKLQLGPVGLILLAIELASLGVAKAWDKLTALFTAGSKASREQSKELSEQSKELGQLADEAKRAADEIERTQAREAEERQFLSVIEQVTAEYKEQTSEIEKQLRLKKYGLEDEAREIEFKHDLRKEELELQAIREDWSDRQLEVALRNNEIERMRELESISLRVSDAELKAADARVKSAQENARATAEASGGSPLVGSQEDLDIIAQDAIEAAQRVNQAIAEQKKARTDSKTASRLLEQSKDWLDDSGDELEGDQLQETLDVLKALGYDKNRILGLDADELKEAYRAAIKYYNDLAKNTTPDDATASDALSRTGLSLSQYIKDDGTIDVDTASKDIASRVKIGVEAFEAQTKAQEKLDEAKAQKVEAERKKILEETRVERSRELNAKRVQVQDEKYQQEQAKVAKEKADAAELERRKAIYSGYSSAQLSKRVAKTAGQSGSLAEADNAAARASLEDKLGQDIDKITEDGRISKQELSQLNNLLPLMEQAGLSAEVLAMLRQLRAIAEEQARTSNSQRAELRILKQQLVQTERAVKQQATGR